MATNYENLIVFKRARVLVRRVYRATASFPDAELYGLVSQMRRAAVSVVSHIAESQGRLTYGESRQMLSQGRGSLYELEAQTIAASDLGYLHPETTRILGARVDAVARPLAGFIRWTQNCEARAKGARQPSTVNRQPDQ